MYINEIEMCTVHKNQQNQYVILKKLNKVFFSWSPSKREQEKRGEVQSTNNRNIKGDITIDKMDI